MRTLDYLFNPDLAGAMWPGVITGIVVAVLCAVLSPIVVLRRMSFVGQGVSHAAFGGVGVAAILGLARIDQPASALEFAIVLGFCAAAALAISALIQRGPNHADTAIGVVLVAAMALGAILVQLASGDGGAPVRSWESILFGSILGVGVTDAWFAGAFAIAVLVTLAWFRRPLLFWAFDEGAASASGVNAGAMKTMLVLLLALAIVIGTRLAGVVLATALLVLPGAIALSISDRLTTTFVASIGASLAGTIGGLVLSFEADLPPGPSIVAVLVGMMAGARAMNALRASGARA